MLKHLIRFWIGDDVFISYSRKDGRRYATNLASELIDLNFSCTFDQWGTQPGEDIPKSLKKKLRRSSSLVLVGTRDAAQSALVQFEVKEFRKTGRPIIPIVFEGVRLRNMVCADGSFVERSNEIDGVTETAALWESYIHGAAMTIETSSNLRSHRPSSEVIGRIRENCRFMRKDQRQRVMAFGASALLCILLVAILVASYAAIVQGAKANEMTQQAQAAAEEAAKQRLIAEDETRKASHANAQAEQSELRANAAATRADEQTKIAQDAGKSAREATAKANLQESNALKSLASNLYTQAHVESLSDPRRALVWASKAVEKAPDSDPLRSLYASLVTHLAAELPGTVINTPSPLRAAIFSDTGDRAIVGAENKQMTLWDLKNEKEIVSLFNATVDASTEVWRTKFSRDGKWIAAIGLDFEALSDPKAVAEAPYRLRVWSAETGTLEKDIRFRWKGFDSFEIAFSPNGNEIMAFATSVDVKRTSLMRVWDRASGSEIKFTEQFEFGRSPSLLRHAFTSNTFSLSQEPSRSWFLNVAQREKDGVVEVRSIRNGKLIKSFPYQGEVIATDLSRNARRLVVVSVSEETKAELRIWDVDSGRSTVQEIRHLERDWRARFLSNVGLAIREVFPILDISPDGTQLLVERGGQCNGLEIWEYTSDNRLLKHPLNPDWRDPLNPLGPCTPGTENALFTDDGKLIIEIHIENDRFFDRTVRVRVWDGNARALITSTRTFPEVMSYQASLKTLKLNMALKNGTLMTSKLLKEGSIREKTTLSLAEDHRLLTTVATQTQQEIMAVSYKPQPQGNPQVRLQLLAADSGAQKWSKDSPHLIRDINFSPDGRSFVSATWEMSTGGWVWWVQRTKDGSMAPGFRGIRGPFYSIPFSRDGTMLVSAELNQEGAITVRKWSAASGEPIASSVLQPATRVREFIKFTRFADYYLGTLLYSEPNLIVQSTNRPDESIELRFSEDGTKALFVALFDSAQEVRLASPSVLELVMDSGLRLLVKSSLQGVEIVDQKSQVLSPIFAQTFNQYAFAQEFALPRVEDISADGTLLALRIDHHTVRIYENRTRRPVSEPFWHEAPLTLVKFSGPADVLTITDRGEKRLWHVGNANRPIPAWMYSIGEAISGFRLMNEIELQRISLVEHAELRERNLKSLQKAAATGDIDAQIVLRNLQ